MKQDWTIAAKGISQQDRLLSLSSILELDGEKPKYARETAWLLITVRFHDRW